MNEKIFKQKDLITQSGLAALVLDNNLNIIEFNDELINITGFSREKIKNRNWHDLINYDYPFTPIDSLPDIPDRAAPKSGKFWCSIKEKIPKKLISATISYDSEKSLYFATLYDISEQVTPQRLVNDGGLLIDSIADHLRGAMAFHDNRGIVRFASSEICRIIGSSKKDIIGHHINEFFDEKLVNKWLILMNEKAESVPLYLEFISSRKKNKVFYVIATPRLFFDYNRKVMGCMFIFTDITELKMNEERLRISDEKYSKAFQASPAPSSITTLAEGRYIDVNESYCAFVGCTKEEIIGRTSTDINFFKYKDDRKKFVAELESKGKLRDYETHVNSRVKGLRTFSLSADLIELQGEKCIIWVGYDVTDEIRLEKEVLEATGRERYNIGQYLHDDLGQHLVGVEAMCSLLENRLKASGNSEITLAGEIHEYMKEALDKTRGAARGLCPVSLEENGFSFAIRDLALRAEKMFGISCIFHNFNIFEIIYNSQIAINMFYIVQEAVNNAVKHASCSEIIITYFSNEDNLYISVEDDGKGFDPKEIASNGMGQSLMKYRARAIGGGLEVNSEPGNGTYILLTFPRMNNKKAEWDWKQVSYEEITDIHR